jgi:hypothetical protein
VRPGGHAKNSEDLWLDCGEFCGEGVTPLPRYQEMKRPES